MNAASVLQENTTLDSLNHILEDNCNLALWKRCESPAPESIKELMKSSFSEIQMIYDRSQPLDVIGAYLDEKLQLSSKDAFYLYKDITLLTQKMASLSNDKQLGIRLERVIHDNCKAFHVDFISLRLLCTYHGPATEWLENSNVNREFLGKNKNEFVIKNKHQIQHFKTNWVGILKGENFFANNGRGLVHRSPQISELNFPDRLLLRIDTLERFGSHL